MADISGIVAALEERLSGINAALTALHGMNGAPAPVKRRGRPAGTKNRKGGMSQDGRRRISEAQKARWAAIKRGT
jgi:hypothetical protein